ncbi:hypothetical protein BH10PLA2_BH10PLA2_27390 [soil metagenome]
MRSEIAGLLAVFTCEVGKILTFVGGGRTWIANQLKDFINLSVVNRYNLKKMWPQYVKLLMTF